MNLITKMYIPESEQIDVDQTERDLCQSKFVCFSTCLILMHLGAACIGENLTVV